MASGLVRTLKRCYSFIAMKPKRQKRTPIEPHWFTRNQAVEIQLHPSSEWTPALYDSPSPLGRRHVVFPRGYLVSVQVPDRRIRLPRPASAGRTPEGSK